VRFKLAYRLLGFSLVSMIVSSVWNFWELLFMALLGLAWIPFWLWMGRLLYAVVLREDGLHWRRGRFLGGVIAYEAIDAIEDDPSKNEVVIRHRLPLNGGKWTSYAITQGFDIKERDLFVAQVRDRVGSRQRV
jgi:hypothetical protein